MLFMKPGNSRRRQGGGGLLSRYRLAQCILIMTISVGVVIRLHQSTISGMTADTEHTLYNSIMDLPSNLYDAAAASASSSRHVFQVNGATPAFQSRHLSHENHKNAAPSTEKGKHHLSPANSARTRDPRDRYGAYASVPDRRPRLSDATIPLSKNATNTGRQEYFRPRKQNRTWKLSHFKAPNYNSRRGTAWIKKKPITDDEFVSDGDETPSEDITSFSYIPVGKYVNNKHNNNNATNSSSSSSSSPYAYAFVMGGVNEQDGRYLGMLYNILIAAYILEKEGSTADVVVYVQMSANSTRDELPDDDVRLLHTLKVKIKYLPKPQVENFHQIIMQKMVVLDLVEYRRVLFLDTDVMPFCNLDYVFQLSDGPNPILKENLIIALSGSPGES
jgi:hypothetical protein